MVFPGRFSTGCMRCRQRKVKCDEAKPTCKRCLTYGKPCPGYTDEFSFKHTRTRSDAKSSLSPSDSSPLSTKIKKKQLSIKAHYPPASTTVAIARPPDPCHEDLSLCYFVRRFVSPDEGDEFPGHFSFLPGLYDHYNKGLLETATLSVSQMAAYNQFGKEEFRTESLKNCGTVIRGLQDIVNSGDHVVDDKVIASILLLCTYKDISGEGLGDPGEHAPGLFYLLERRGPEQIGTRRGAELFLLALLRLQVYSFLHEDGKYSDPGAIATLMGIFDPLFRALSMMSQTLSLRHRLLALMRFGQQQDSIPSPTSDAETVFSYESVDSETEQAVLLECFEMIDRFYVWDQEAAVYWQSIFKGRGVPTGLGQMSCGTTHYDAETACIIILVRSARLILMLAMLVYHSQLPSSAAALWTECIAVLKSDVSRTIEDMLAAVPYALGDINVNGKPAMMSHDGAAAITIVHSIRLISHCAYASPAQLERADIILKRMNSAIGIRSAVSWTEGQDYGLGLGRERSLSWQSNASTIASSYGIMETIELSPGGAGFVF